MRLPVNQIAALPALLLLSACGGHGGPVVSTPAASALGPAGDYPVVIGKPFTIGDVTYTPSDTLNYDKVGHAVIEPTGSDHVAAASKTLPLPSYVEVTSLDTGRTALVRVETRGPMRNDALIALSPSAAAQLGFAPGTMPAVRVRRVNPVEADRAMLRAGETAPLRLDTPPGLLTVLRRKLPENADKAPPPLLAHEGATPIKPIDPDAPAAGVGAPAAAPPVKTDAKIASAAASTAKPPSAGQEATAVPAPTPHKTEGKAAESTPAPAKATGNLVVQVGAFSTRANAEKAAGPLSASVSQSGKYWIVRTGPYSSRKDAAAGLEKVRAAGYRDAMVKRAD